jgi:hypothetical protein
MFGRSMSRPDHSTTGRAILTLKGACGEADITAARAMQPNIAEEFARYGVI